MFVLICILGFLIMIGILVVVHEYGHYWVAKRCGVKVLRFSFGFGKVLFSRQLGADQTEWSISLIPLGGYVKMLDEREAPVAEEEKHRAFNQKAVWQRALIAAAGPVANFILAILLLTCVNMLGVPDTLAKIGTLKPDSIAAQAGLQENDQILSINGQKIATWSAFQLTLIEEITSANSLQLEVKRLDDSVASIAIPIDLQKIALQKSVSQQLGFDNIKFLSAQKVLIDSVLPDSIAAQAGLLAGDKIQSLNGQVVEDEADFRAQIQNNADKKIVLGIERNNTLQTVSLVPKRVQENGESPVRIGIGMAQNIDPVWLASIKTKQQYMPLRAFVEAVKLTGQQIHVTLKVFKRLLTGDISTKVLSGPAQTAKVAGIGLILGLVPFLQILAAISIGIGVFNLLPIPVLDGGHLLFLGVEAILRKPIPVIWLERTTQAGFALIMCLVALALFNDFSLL